jgi:20S proteasome subunit beta 1
MDLNAYGRGAAQACSNSRMSDAEPHTGTTIIACTFNGGVVLGADGRVSTGNYVSNRASNKIMQLTDNVFLLRSGSAADTQAVGDYGKQQPQQQQQQSRKV